MGMKMPKEERDQFKVFLRLFEKMFKKEMTDQKRDSIISKVDKEIKNMKRG